MGKGFSLEDGRQFLYNSIICHMANNLFSGQPPLESEMNAKKLYCRFEFQSRPLHELGCESFPQIGKHTTEMINLAQKAIDDFNEAVENKKPIKDLLIGWN